VRNINTRNQLFSDYISPNLSLEGIKNRFCKKVGKATRLEILQSILQEIWVDQATKNLATSRWCIRRRNYSQI